MKRMTCGRCFLLWWNQPRHDPACSGIAPYACNCALRNAGPVLSLADFEAGRNCIHTHLFTPDPRNPIPP